MNRLLGPVEGLRVLDAGCGTGRHALRLAERGAVVTGVDFSSGMLAQAREKAGAERVRFVEHDLAAPLPFEAGAFDRVVCGLVLDHIERLEPFLRELGRVCTREGWLVLTVVHPAVLLRGLTSRLRDPATGEEILPAYYPHQISDYVMGMLGAGMSLQDLGERSGTEGPFLGWPLLLTIRASP